PAPTPATPAPTPPTPATPAPAPAAPVVPPAITHQEPPIFPDVPADQKKPTDAVVHVDLDAAGTITNTRVVSSPGSAFDDLALLAVSTWTFSPATQDGQPVAGGLDVTVHFDPDKEPTVGTEQIDITDTLSKFLKGHSRPPDVGSAETNRQVDKVVAAIPQPHGSTSLLGTAAPGFLLTNEGGEGHAEQIFLRGFDAREGQDIELRVNGDVINQVGNLHGNGYADLHFVIPELVESLRVVEGPYDPRQGNFAVAGSADYTLGLVRRGLYASYGVGSFGTNRALLLWGPPKEDSHTFGGVEIYNTDGFGQNRDARRATALGQVEGKAGETGIWRLTSGAYLTDYHSAGVVREDDYAAGRAGFYDTYDFGQGGGATRAFVLGDIETQHDDVVFHHQLSLTAQTLHLREDFTGFLLDQQSPFQRPHAQRGDLIDLESDAVTAQAQGFAREDHTIGGHVQEAEVGYAGRIDLTSGQEYRIKRSNGHPYDKETDLDATIGDIGLYGALALEFTDWLRLRGGVRTDLFTYNVIDNCAVQEIAHPSEDNPPGDQSCLSLEDYGKYREPVQRAAASGSVVLPRATLLFGPFAHVTASIGYGEGVRSIDPSYISQGLVTPFASIKSYEAGATYDDRHTEGLSAKGALTFFHTHVDHDLVFSETAGRNLLAGGSTRNGVSLSGQLTGSWFEESASATLVQSTFDDTGLLIPYVPDLVIRSDSVVSGDLPWCLDGTHLTGVAGAGITYVGRRALPYGQRSDTIFTIDGSGSIGWRRYRLGVQAENLLDTRYRLGEYNYASDFHSQAQPTLTIARHFTAGAPRTVLFQLEVKL
ncbi:MAG TPA: TonB family protein, partial [Kofleriaceae bacterium]|nr:TonB family protein [Kofleriaceae bacterium]